MTMVPAVIAEGAVYVTVLLAGAEAAGREPAVVGEIDDRAGFDVTQKDERERVRARVVLDDGDVAD